jgi:glycosyltransferase involved in cell wall biosynthesis
MPVFLVTCFPTADRGSWPGNLFGRSLARGDRDRAVELCLACDDRALQIRPNASAYPARDRYRHVQSAAVNADRVAALRRAWGVLPQMRVVLIPGRIAPWNGQMTMIDAARLFGRRRRPMSYSCSPATIAASRVMRARCAGARMHGIDTLCRLTGPCPDMPAALVAADVVVATALQPPLSGRSLIEAQALGRPVDDRCRRVAGKRVVSPRMRDELRTGWLVRPGDAGHWRARSAPLASTPRLRRWRARANSPTSHSLRKALPRPFWGSIRRYWHAILS